MWSAAKAANAPPFPGPASEWDVNKLRLVKWTQLYDSVYEAYERPPDYIIEDDTELDKWLDEVYKEREAEREEQWRERKKQNKKRGGQNFIPSGKNVRIDEFIINPDE